MPTAEQWIAGLSAIVCWEFVWFLAYKYTGFNKYDLFKRSSSDKYTTVRRRERE